MRYSSNDIKEIGRLNEGTSAQYIGYNTKTGRKGIYKETGCVLGIENDDIREKLSSEILRAAGVDVADIDLVYDEYSGQNTYFSNYIIEDDEKLVTPDIAGCESKSQNPIENMCERYMQGIRKLTDDETFIQAARKNFYIYTYACCMIDCYDIKPDNLPIIQNRETGEYSIAPYFDFGTAFCEEHKSSPIYNTSSDEILNALFENNYKDIKDIVARVNTKLTTDKIEQLFANDYLTQTMDASTIENMKTRLLSQIEKSRQLEMSKKQVVTERPKGIKAFFGGIKDKIYLLMSKIKGVKLLSESHMLEYEDKEKLASLGYSSVAEMNADDPEAKMFKQLKGGIYPPSEAIRDDLEQGEQIKMSRKSIKEKEI